MNSEKIGATLDLLQRHTGAKNAVRLSVIAAGVYGGSDAVTMRRTRENIAALRLQGYPVVSESRRAGYYMAANDEERRVIAAEILSRVRNLLRVYNSIKPMGDHGQPEFYEVEKGATK